MHRAGLARPAQSLEYQDGHGVGLFAGGAAGHPDAYRFALPLGGHQGADHLGVECFPSLRIAEEISHPDQQVVKQRVDLGAVFFEQRHVIGLAQYAAQAHAPPDAPQQRGTLVALKVIAAAGVDDVEQASCRLFVALIDGRIGGDRDIRVAGVGAKNFWHSLYRQHIVDKAGGDGAAWHALDLCGRGLLRQNDATVRGDGFQAQRAISAGPRKHDANSPRSAVLAERIKKKVDRQMGLFCLVARRQSQAAARYRQLLVGRCGVDMVCQKQRAVARFAHGHGGEFCEQFRGEAGMGRIEMLDDDEGNAALGGHAL